MIVTSGEDWRLPIIDYLRDTNTKTNRIIKCRAINYVLLGDALYRKVAEGLILLCVNKSQSMKIMGETR